MSDCNDNREICENSISDEEFRERANLLSTLVNKYRLGIVILNQEFEVVDANQRFADMLGYTLEEVKNLHIWDWEVISTEDEIRAYFSDLSIVDFFLETRHRRKDGSIFDVEINGTGTSFFGKNGKQNMGMCICQDITARKLMEKQLLASENKYRRFVENAADIVITLNPSLNITYISPNCKRILGYEPEELTRKNMLSCFIPEDGETFILSVQSCLNGELNQPTDYRIIHQNNQIEWYSILFSKTEDEDGNPQIICNARNITDKKKYEKNLEYYGMHDLLTGIFNRVYFRDELIRQSQKNNYPITLISFDLDNLKGINDAFGHIAGDKLLKDCALLVSNSLRKGDVFARMGGDEFAVILPSTTEEEAGVIVKRIEQSLAVYNENHPHTKLSISIGIAAADTASDPLELVLFESDKLMYQQKKEKKLALERTKYDGHSIE
jgi:diguanylate cyclase (GGDEF)-like protein/PAS domain S-box-containing protein